VACLYIAAVRKRRTRGLRLWCCKHCCDCWCSPRCSACEGDPFTAKLLELLQLVNNEGVRQPLSLGVLRSDYMIDEGPDASSPSAPALRQIELNTVSCSFAALSSRLTLAHQSLVSRFGASDAGFIAHLRDAGGGGGAAAMVPHGGGGVGPVDSLPPSAASAAGVAAASKIPANAALTTIVAAMAAAHAAYGVPS
jgi:hypothetical protein